MKIETTIELNGADLSALISDYLKEMGYNVKGDLSITINTKSKTDSGNKQSWGYLKDGLLILGEIDQINS